MVLRDSVSNRNQKHQTIGIWPSGLEVLGNDAMSRAITGRELSREGSMYHVGVLISGLRFEVLGLLLQRLFESCRANYRLY